jgi:hypothetical protein
MWAYCGKIKRDDSKYPCLVYSVHLKYFRKIRSVFVFFENVK